MGIIPQDASVILNSGGRGKYIAEPQKGRSLCRAPLGAEKRIQRPVPWVTLIKRFQHSLDVKLCASYTGGLVDQYR
jgi:hypothetical protein